MLTPIRVPVDTTINFRDYISVYPTEMVTGGKFLRVRGGDPITDLILGPDYDYELDSCTGTIIGTSVADAQDSVTFTANGWTDCGTPTGPPATPTGCCESPFGTIQNGVTAAQCAAAGGTFSEAAACPPIGCCTLGDGSRESNVTESYCNAEGGSWAAGACPDLPTGCCAIIGGPDQNGKTQAECNALGGTWTEGVNCDGSGWCIDDTDGSVTANVEENDCTGTFSATEPVMGCCTIGGTQNPDVAQQWCTAQSGTFVAGDCRIWRSRLGCPQCEDQEHRRHLH